MNLRSTPYLQFPADLKTLAVKPPMYDYRGFDDGILRDQQQAWYHLFLARLRQQLQQHAPQIRILDRDDTGSRIDEGALVEGQPGGQGQGNVRHFFAEALIQPRFRLTVEVVREVKSRSLHKVLLERGAAAGASWIPRVGRCLAPTLVGPRQKAVTLVRFACQADVSVVLTATGRQVGAYSEIIEVYDKTKDGIFGYGRRTITDLTSPQSAADQLIWAHTDAFLARFFPIDQQVVVMLDDVDETTRQAVLEFNRGQFKLAAQLASTSWSASSKKGEKAAAAAFIVGMAAESDAELARPKAIEYARTWFANAVNADQGDPIYLEALKRITSQQSLAKLGGTQTHPNGLPKPEDEVEVIGQPSVDGGVQVIDVE